jgi:hypothetical protein
LRVEENLTPELPTNSAVETLIALLKDLFTHEEKLENARENLVKRCSDFNTHSAVRLFDADPS